MSFKSPLFIASAGASAMILGNAAFAQVAPGGSGAQDGGPIVVGERQPLETFRLFNFRGGVELFGGWRQQEERIPDREKQRSTELQLRESVDLSSEGFVLHPNFLELDLFGRFGAEQTRSTFTGLEPVAGERGGGWSYDYLLEHDAIATFMKNSRVPLTLHTRRSQTLFNRPFGETLESISTEHGARLSFRNVAVPTELSYRRIEQDTSSGTGFSDFEIEQDTFAWDSTYSPSNTQFITWNYTYDDIRQSGAAGATSETRRHTAFLGHTIDFGEDRQHNLNSSVSLYHEDGSFELTRIRWHEALRLRHTPRFETRYDYTLDYATRPNVDQMLHRGTAGFRHRLFESLTSVGTVGASRLTLDEGSTFTSETVFGDLELQYTKRIPYGRLAAFSGINYTRQDDSGGNGDIQIVQEPHTFSPTGLVLIDRRNIILSSITITDAAGVFTFRPGLDYTVQSFGDRVEIRRVLGGEILDGQTVLIDYRVALDPANVTTSLGWRFGVRYDVMEGWLAGLGVYGRYAEQDQSRDAEADIVLEDFDLRDFVVGADYTLDDLTLQAEHQWRDSSLSPFRSLRLEGRYARPIDRYSSVLLTAAYRDIDRYRDDVQTQILTVNARWNQQLSERWRAGLELQFRDERDRPGIHVQAFEQQLDVSWRYRQTSLFALARNAFIESDARDATFQNFQLGVRRDF
jgi:predicted porin